MTPTSHHLSWTLRRGLALAALTALLVVVLAPPAMAHGRGSDASNYLSLITGQPSDPAIEVAVINSDEYLQLTNTGDEEVLIPGYVQEPYLRIGPDGVFRNRNSQATYLNEDRFGETVVPADVSPGAEPDWEQVSDGQTYAWHDHRIHWMVQNDPPAVAQDPMSEHLINVWSVPVLLGDTEMAVTGELFWVPGGSPWIWLVPALIAISVPVALVMARTQPDTERYEWREVTRVAGGILLVIAVSNIIHLIDDLFATPIPLAEAAVSAIQTFFFITIAVTTSIIAVRGREGSFTALGVGSAAVFIGQGMLYFSVLGASQTASLFDGSLTRVIIACSVAQVIPMGAAAVIGTRKLLPELDDEDGDLAAEAALA